MTATVALSGSNPGPITITAILNGQADKLARLVGMDFFDGVVRLDQIAAVIVRVRNN